MTIELAPSDDELFAARAAGMSYVKWRAMRDAIAPFVESRHREPTPAFHEDVTTLADQLPYAAIRVVLPFAALCPDNRKYGVIGGKLILTRRYRAAKRAIHGAAMQQYQGPVLDVPCQLTAQVWFPNHRHADAPNFAKATHDALQRVCYLKDSLVYDARWMRAGIDKRRPRAELTITPLERP